MRDPRATDQGLGWYTADIHASTTEQVTLDNGGLQTTLGQLLGQRGPGLSGTDDDGIKFFQD